MTVLRLVFQTIMRWRNPCCNDRGKVAVITLVFVAVLAVVGTTAYLITSNELLISGNYKAAE